MSVAVDMCAEAFSFGSDTYLRQGRTNDRKAAEDRGEEDGSTSTKKVVERIWINESSW